ncbi:hypothetical protein HYPSUDRAFT_46672 [Hypholoma sublateritium FD-334 SS-4]|uniref:Uncharacterized protein n=1 Tax=Hypholoma sublateritium (strain FD-334 SS-4) TaxID=945553 RepID=A0A0D2PA84_HYPSF|nr:hypothetical protein HYPSUDRAFT_46672 [Hypholoma sublateritium FD-334 SS-4]
MSLNPLPQLPGVNKFNVVYTETRLTHTINNVSYTGIVQNEVETISGPRFTIAYAGDIQRLIPRDACTLAAAGAAITQAPPV